MRTAAIAIGLVAATLGVAAATPRRGAMHVADDRVCALLQAQLGDRCAAIATTKAVTVYASGTPKGITRVVLAVTTPSHDTLLSPPIDVVGARRVTAPAVGAIAGGVAAIVRAGAEQHAIGCRGHRCVLVELDAACTDVALADDHVVACGAAIPLE